ncbi:methyltransferase [Candidatus Micrarchaeota archaeon]|nr:methyltransferase [Candidatus Micrarchaeota archaeon]
MLVTEESIKLDLPKKTVDDPHHAFVFYNPVMQFSRSISSLALSVSKASRVLDGLSASGARGLRYYKENDLDKVVFVDANPDAVKTCKKNLKLNKVKAKVLGQDLNQFFLTTEEKFDFIEIDPFGTPAPFLKNAFACGDKKFFLSVTATDLANLCARKEACFKYYQSLPLNIDCTHEIALRIFIKKIAQEAIQNEYSCKPLFSFYKGHYVKAVLYCEKYVSAKALENIGYLNYDPETIERSFSSNPGEKFGGPLWIGKLQDSEFLKKMISLNKKRNYADKEKINSFLDLLLAENDFDSPFIDLSQLADHYNKSMDFKMNELVSKLNKKGKKTTRVHYNPYGIKTTASFKELRSSF